MPATPMSADPAAPLTISPTDVSQFIRLEQCERFLRLRLRERAEGRDFLLEADVAAQAISPILSRSGSDFERAVEAGIEASLSLRRFGPDRRRRLGLSHDNADTVAAIAALRPGQTLVLTQPRLQAPIGGWRLRGDVDLIRAERDADGTLRILIADMKSSAVARIEHRLQVAFYHEMLETLLHDADVPHAPIGLGIVYRGRMHEPPDLADDERLRLAAQRDDAVATFGIDGAHLERVREVDAYLASVRDLVTGERSTARRVLETDFDAIPFHLTAKCDGCLYNEYCMKRSAETDDLSLLPHLTELDKRALQRHGIAATRDLAALKRIERKGTMLANGERQPDLRLVPNPGEEARCRTLAGTWPVGSRLDELIHRAIRYNAWRPGQEDRGLTYIPNASYGSMPWTDPEQNPNLVRLYIDAQQDYLNDRVYLLGALITGHEGGEQVPHRRRSVVHLADAPVDTEGAERALFLAWIDDVLRAVVEVAAPDAEGVAKAPIHLTFTNGGVQQVLLDGLARHADAVLGATALYDFVTQIAAFDSPIVGHLETEIRDRQNYPMLCQSLQSVAAFRKFDWNSPEPYRDVFRSQMFDYLGRFDQPRDDTDGMPGRDGWYTRRARFSSSIPLEYATAAWGRLPEPVEGRDGDIYRPYRDATPALLRGFQARRLEAMEHIAKDLRGNSQTTLSAFSLPDLAAFTETARDLAHALNEFVIIERHVGLADWKRTHQPAPEQRLLAGTTLIAAYHEEDQDPGVAERNRENTRRRELREELRAAWREKNPEKKQVRLPKEDLARSTWQDAHRELEVRLRLTTDGAACDLDTALRLTTLGPDSWIIVAPRWTVDSRKPADQQEPFTPTVKQLLGAMRATLLRLDVHRDVAGRAVGAWAVVQAKPTFGNVPGFTFSAFGDNERPFEPGTRYTLDTEPGDINAGWAKQLTDGLVEGGESILYRRLAAAQPGPDDEIDALPESAWPEAAAAGQRQFMAGLEALHAAERLHGFESSKHDFIGGHGDTPILLVQGPPGTGKSYSTAFAILARLQGAMTAGVPCRVLLSCISHAAIDVLVTNLAQVQDQLRRLCRDNPGIARDHFDERLFHVPIFRYRGREHPPAGVTPLPKQGDQPKGTPGAIERLTAHHCAVIAATPGAVFGLVGKERFGRDLIDIVVLDEASQMGLPQAIMAALPLKPDGRLIVVGDHRQMPPIVKHDWASEQRRSFRRFRSYESLFLTLLAMRVPVVKFAQSFRLHADMARFLRDEIYIHDGIDYHATNTDLLDAQVIADPFLAAVLDPTHPITVVVHDEAASQMRNDYERGLIVPLLEILHDPAGLALDIHEGMGVVVPHRTQRAALQGDLRAVLGRDADDAIVSAVDTVERFQGGERMAILIGSTESDREYILTRGDFMLDPRRLTVAMSRAKRKLVLVASRSVFEVFSADEETFANAQLWKNLLRRTCTERVWAGERNGHNLTVWGNTRMPTGDAQR